MASFKLAAAALLAIGSTSAFVGRNSFTPSLLHQSAIQTNALYANNGAMARRSSLNMVVAGPTEVGGRGGMFTASNAENRRIVPEERGTNLGG